jgi:signal transduction histidine kinase
LLLCAALVCAAVAAMAVYAATSQPWLGLNLAAGEDQVSIQSVDPEGPSAAVPAGRLLAVGDFTLEPRDVVPEPDATGRYAEVARFYERQTRLAAHQASGATRITVRAADGDHAVTVAAVSGRPIGDLSVEFWVQVLAGVIAFVIGAWVWALKPSDWAARFFALSGLSMLAFTNSAAVYSTRELALGGALFEGLSLTNMAGAVTFGVAMINLFLVYPKRLVAAKWLWAAPLVAVVWSALAYAGLLGAPAYGGALLTLVEMITILVVIGWQAVANRRDPVGKAVLTWLGLSVALGAGAFVFLTAIPTVLGFEAAVSQGYAFGFFLIIYVGLALGLRRYRLFEMGEWAFRILFYTGAALAFLALDALLIAALHMAPTGAIGLSLLMVAFLYLPLRDVIWRRTVARRRIADGELFESVLGAAFAGSPAARADRWRELVQRLFDPLEMTPATGHAAETSLSSDGLELVLPATADAPAYRLRYPWRGRGLFGPVHLKLARELTRLMRHADASRDAFERGAAGERGRIARDLHDDVGARLLSGLHKSDVAETREVVREAIADMRTIVSGLTGAALPLSEVVAQLRHETARRLEAAGIELDWPISLDEADETPLSYPVYRNWSAIHREVVSNVIRHSGARALRVDLAREGDHLTIVLADDGKGLAKDRKPGNGLANIARRAAELGGTVTYPLVDAGCSLRLSIPLRHSSAKPTESADV